MGKRMYYILKILFESKNAITRDEIADKLMEEGIEINVKTISATIQSLNEFFYEFLGYDLIKSIKKKGFIIDSELFEDGQMQFIIDSIMCHQDISFQDKNELKNKLLRFSSINQKDRLSVQKENDTSDKFSILVNLSAIIKAIENNKMISFQYISYDACNGKLKEVVSDKSHRYNISPYEIMIQNNHYYLISYNEKYKDRLSMYRIDRMRNVVTLRQSIKEIREQYDMEELVKKMMNMYVSDVSETFIFECNEKILREVVSRFGLEHSANKIADKKYRISINDVSISEGLIGWILMLHDNIKVISPESLKEDIKEKVKNMNKLYD